MRILLALALAAPLSAAYTYFLNDTFTSGIFGPNWQPNGTISRSASDGLTSGSDGSVIYTGAVKDANNADLYFENSAKLKITASGGKFFLYQRASQDALAGSGAQGSFLLAEFSPTVNATGCTMAVEFRQREGGAVSVLASQTLACKDGMTVRWSQRQGYFSIITSLNELAIVGNGTTTGGRPGFGVSAMPSGNGILEGKVGNLEYTAPGAIDPASVRSALFDNRVDLAWTGVVDDANGSGFLMYWISRNGTYMGSVRGAAFSDSTVLPSTQYTYVLYPHDVHLNYSARQVVVTTPASGMKDQRKTGVRPLGTYWGASPGNIDLQSGNLSFSLPTVTAKGRGGMWQQSDNVPFEQSRNVPLTDPGWWDGRRTTTDDASR